MHMDGSKTCYRDMHCKQAANHANNTHLSAIHSTKRSVAEDY